VIALLFPLTRSATTTTLTTTATTTLTATGVYSYHSLLRNTCNKVKHAYTNTKITKTLKTARVNSAVSVNVGSIATVGGQLEL